MASIKYHKSFTKPVAFTFGLLTRTFCLDSGVDTNKFHDCGVDPMPSGVDTSFTRNNLDTYFSLQMQVQLSGIFEVVTLSI